MSISKINEQTVDYKESSKIDYNVILKDILRGQLRKINRYSYCGAENEFSAANIERAIDDLDVSLSDGLITASKKIYDKLLLGESYPEIVGEGDKTQNFNLNYIDWDNPRNNVLHVTREFFVESQDKMHNARPDIVLFINGIPFAIIECKAPTESVDAAVNQNWRNQQNEYIPQLFKFSQIIIATNKNDVKYATTKTPQKFWSVWKEDSDFYYSLNGKKVLHCKISGYADEVNFNGRDYSPATIKTSRFPSSIGT